MRTIDGLLEEALGGGRKYSQGLEMVTEAVLAGERLRAEQGELKDGGGALSDATLNTPLLRALCD